MKITAVLGSPNRNGNTAALVERALAGAEKAGADTELLFLKDYRIEFCLGCLSSGAGEYCMSSGRCNIRDDVEELKKKLYTSDGIIFASPSYGIEPKQVAKHMAREFAAGFFDRGYMSGALGVLVGSGSARELNEELDTAYRLGEKLAGDIRRGKKYPLQLIGKRILTRIMIRPVILKNILTHKDHEMHAVYENLTARGYIS